MKDSSSLTRVLLTKAKIWDCTKIFGEKEIYNGTLK